jgi:hypothetical protein
MDNTINNNNKKQNKDQVVVKRRPGRPCLVNKHDKQEKKGIVDTPNVNDNVIEFISDSPLIFKKIFSIFKNMNVKQVDIKFTETSVSFNAEDHSLNSYCFLNIHCSKIFQYYCSQPVNITVDFDHIYKITQKITKVHEKLIIMSKEKSYRNKLFIIINNTQYAMQDQHKIDLIEKVKINEYNYEKIFNFQEHPIYFQIDSKLFKDIINNIQSFSNMFAIEISGKDRYLRFPHSTSHKTIESQIIWLNGEKIKLRTDINKNDIIKTQIYIPYIKPISNNIISDNINFYITKERDFIINNKIEKDTFDLIFYIKSDS